MTIGAVLVFAIGGVLLVICEIFIPGGIAGTLGGILLAVAIVGGFLIDPSIGVGLLIGSLLFGGLAFWLWVKFFPKTSVGRQVILQTNAADWHGFDKSKSSLRGRTGVAHTALRPGGIAVVDGKRIDVVTRGEMVEPTTPIIVLNVEGNRVVVAPQESEA